MIRVCRRVHRLWHDTRASSAVEFSVIALPFVMVVLLILQMSLYVMTQSALDAGTIAAADSLINTFYSGTNPTMPTNAALKTMITSSAGGLVQNGANLSVDLRLLSALSTSVVPVGSQIDASVPGSVLALRAQARVATFVPGFTAFAYVRSSALVRRQGK